MLIETFVLGDFQANCYCVRADAAQEDCILIDPGQSPFSMIQSLQNNGLKPTAIILTHGHIDHIGGVEMVREQWPQIQVYIHKADAAMLTDPDENLSMLAGTVFQARPAEKILDGQTQIEVAGLQFKILYTPGHTLGGICLYNADEGVVFAGDTLFAGSIGRSDFPGGDYEQLIQGIKTKLLTLPDTTKVYPGHGPATTIRNEKRHNPFLS
ncbi:MAG: MBL fold metallo-hydrolase [Planctomycetes bacterium]|nr:MBL fold metallo-hydrolase [Planctomycetota bacterium]